MRNLKIDLKNLIITLDIIVIPFITTIICAISGMQMLSSGYMTSICHQHCSHGFTA